MRYLRGALRPAAAFVLMLSFSLFTAETLIADVHDGDAGAAHAGSIESSAPHSHENSGDAPAGSPGHSMHVCHCVHSHAGPTTVAPLLLEPVVNATALPIGSDRTPRSAERELHLRPPIA